MVANVSGNSLGLWNTSAATLGQNGLIGDAANGATNEEAIVNVSNGNLILQSDDDFLAGQGLNINSLRTYNSQGISNEGNGLGWSMSMIKLVGNLTGTVNTAASTITRTDGDGSQVVYTYNGINYVGHDGTGADDTLSYSSKTKTWTWTDGSTGSTETYGSNGYITGAADLYGNKLTYTYTAGLLTKITDANGDSTNYIYNANGNLAQISDDASGVTTTCVYYTYNALNQLSNVTTDLNPSENGISDSNDIYWTNYFYNSTGEVSQVTQKDGAQLNIGYVQVNGQEYVQTVADALGNTTTYSYGANNQTTVTDPLGNVSTYTYDSQGRLTNVLAPVINGVAQGTSYGYDSNGDLTSATDALGNTTQYTYDANGNLTQTVDPLGDATTNTYSGNLLTSRTVYLTPATGTVASTLPASQPETTYYVYNAHNQIAFEISSTGRVTQHTYNSGTGDMTTTVDYGGNLYSVGSPGGPGSALSPTNLPTLAQLNAWVASGNVDLTQTIPTHYTYNTRGQLIMTDSYTGVSSTGAAIGGQATKYTYSPSGQLLQTIDGNGHVTSYLYDSLGRLLSTVNASGVITSTAYNDANSGTAITTTLASGLVTTKSYNADGELVGVVQSSANSVLNQTTYAYDANGNLLMTTNPDGQSSYYLYDADNRQIASITADGELTQTVYDADNQVSAVIQYMNLVDTSLLVNSSGAPDYLGLNALINPAGGAVNPVYSTSLNVYDNAGRRVYTVDANGYVTQTNYDGASNVVGITAYANGLTSAQLQALGTSPTVAMVAADIVPAPGVEGDRSTFNYYDSDNLVIGTLNADGYLTQYIRNGAGQITQTIAYADAPNVIAATLATDSLTTLLAATAPSVNDIVETNFYNAAGQLADALDGDGYLTAYTYDTAGNLTKEIRYATQATVSVNGMATAAVGDVQIGVTSFSALAWTTNAEDHTTKYTYTVLNQVASETDPGGVTTLYSYDNVGNLISTTVETGATDVNARTTTLRYNVQGQLTAEVSGDGGIITYTYDAAGNRTSMTDADNNRTLYYYDQDNRLVYTVDGAGDVGGQTYTNQGQVYQTTSYANSIPALTLAAMTGGALTANALNAFHAASSPQADRTTTYAYDGCGELVGTTDALGYAVTNEYDAFGDIVTRLTQVDSMGDDLEQDYTFDNLGQVTNTSAHDNESKVVGSDTITASTTAVEQTYTEYDAFGRVIRTQDGNLQATNYTYDQLGREIAVTDPTLGAVEYTTYDAFNRVIKQTDFNGSTTSTSYDTAKRSMTVTSSQGVTQTIVENEFGQQATLTDGNGNVTTYTYDFDGNLTSVKDKLGIDISETYDAAGNLDTSTDANGAVTTYAYDAANRVISKTVDPNGLDLVTLYSYNTSGQVLSVTDPRQIVTQTTYDKKGQVTSIAVDPAGLNLVTTFEYNGTGLTVQVTSPSGNQAGGQGTDPTQGVTQYQYDALGRRVSQTIDPAGFGLSTYYAYDDDNNLISATAPNGNIISYVYDADNRVIYTIDGAGDVSHTVYDADGNVIQTTSYANPIDASALANLQAGNTNATPLNAGAITPLLTPEPTSDNTVQNVYDSDNRLIYSVDGTNAVTQYTYDGNGNVTQKKSYATPVPLGTGLTLTGIAGAIQASSSDRTSINVYDARNRLVDQISGSGAVTAYVYDANGNVIEKTGYATAGTLSTLPANPTAAQVKTWLGSAATNSANSVTRMVYDNANRLIDTATAQSVSGGVLQWAVVQTAYDADGNAVGRMAFANMIASNALATATQAQVITAIGTVVPNVAQDRNTQMAYDAAGRMIASATAQHVDANGNLLWSVVQYSYDANGNLIASTAFSNYLSSASRTATDTTANWIDRVAPNAAADRTTRMVYDSDNRQIFSIDTLGDVTQTVYDGNGNVINTVAYANPVALSGLLDTPAQVSALEVALTPSGQSWSNWSSWVNDGNNRITATVYDAANRAVYQINALGYVIQNSYDGNGNMVQSYAYSGAIGPTLVASATSIGLVQQWMQEYDVQSSLDRIIDNAFDADNRLIYTVNANGFVTQNVYDALGRVTKTVQYAQDNVAFNFYGSILAAADIVAQLGSIDSLGQYDYLSDSNNRTTSFQYDAQGNLVSSTDALGNTETYVYNGLNEKVGFTNTLNAVWSYLYDAAGNLINETDPGVTTTNVSISTGITNATTDSYTAATTSQVDAQLQTLTSYDAFGDVLGSTQQQLVGKVATASTVRLTQYEYDLTGRQTETMSPTVDVYVASDNLAKNGADSQIGVAGQINVATRDETNVTPTTIVTYDALGNAISNQDAAGDLSYKIYNNLGQVTYAIDGDGYVTGYQYNAFGETTSLTRYANPVPAGSLNSQPSEPLQIVQLFAMIFGDAPASSGLAYWTGLLAGGASVASVAQGLIDTAVLSDIVAGGANAMASESPTSFVNQLYQNALGRQPASGEATYWITEASAAGVTRGQVVSDLLNAILSGGSWAGTQYFDNVVSTNLAALVPLRTAAQMQTLLSSQASSLDRVVTTQYDQLGQVTEVIDPPSEIYSDNGSQMVYDMDNQATLNRYNAFGEVIEQSVVGLNGPYNYQDAVGSDVRYYYDNMGNQTATLTLANDAFVEASEVAAGLATAQHGGGSCFLKGTLVHTNRGLVPIEEIRIGDMVLAQPEKTGELSYKPVAQTFVNDQKAIFRVTYANDKSESETLFVTPNHPIWVKDAGWTRADQLEIGSTLELHERSPAIVTEVFDSGAVDTVYNFAVSDFHTYYVGELGAWVHNISAGPSGRLPEWYLTTNQYDPFGNLTAQTQFATLTTIDQNNPDTSYDTPQINASDRTTVYLYDVDNRKISQTVNFAYTADLTGAANVATLDANTASGLTTTYTYDALGNQTSVTDPTGATTYTYRNALGQVTDVATTSVGATLPTFTQFNLNIYGDVVQEIQYANGNVGATQQTGLTLGNATGFTQPTPSPAGAVQQNRSTETIYNIDGNAIETINALGNATFTSYDVLGRVAKTWESVTMANPSPVASQVTAAPSILETSFTVNVYDADGNVVDVITPGALTVNSQGTGATVALVNKQSTYDAFGDVTVKSLNGAQYEIDVYDNAGNLALTNSGNGVYKVNFYDLAGQITEQVTSDDIDLSQYYAQIPSQNGTLQGVDTTVPGVGALLQNGTFGMDPNASAQNIATLLQEGTYGLMAAQTYYNRMGQVIEQVAAAQYVDSTPVVNGMPQAPASGTVLAMSASAVVHNQPSTSTSPANNTVIVNMSSLEGLGSGDLKVQIDYTTAATSLLPSENFTQSQVFGADQVVTNSNPINSNQPDSLTLNLGATPAVDSVERVQVWKKDVSGQWDLLIDNGAQSTVGNYVAVSEPQDATTPITVQYQVVGGYNAAADLAADQILNFGDVVLFNTNSIPEGTVNYTVTYQDIGDSAPTMHDGGTLTLVSPETQIAQLYVAILNRAPDYGSMNIWLNQYRNGETIDEIAEAMYETNAANINAANTDAANGPAYTAADFITNFFTNALGLPADDPQLLAALGNPQFYQIIPLGALTDSSVGHNITTLISGMLANGADWGMASAVQLFDNKVTVAKLYAQYQGSDQSIGSDLSLATSILTLVTPTDISVALAAMVVESGNATHPANFSTEFTIAQVSAAASFLALDQSNPMIVVEALELYAAATGQAPTAQQTVDAANALQGGEAEADVVNGILGTGPIPMPQDANDDANLSTFISGIIQNAFGRTPDAAELANWVSVATDAVIAANQSTPYTYGDLVVAIVNGAEPANAADAGALASTVAANSQALTASAQVIGALQSDPLAAYQVTELYATIFGRAPDISEMADAINGLNAGETAGALAQSLLASPEAVNGHYPYSVGASSDPTAFINQLFTMAFNRSPTAAEVTYWLGVYDADTNASNLQTDPTASGDLLVGILNATNEAGGPDSTTLANTATANLQTLVVSLQGSTLSLGQAQQTVTQLYELIYGQMPGRADIDNWAAQLQADPNEATIATQMYDNWLATASPTLINTVLTSQGANLPWQYNYVAWLCSQSTGIWAITYGDQGTVNTWLAQYMNDVNPASTLGNAPGLGQFLVDMANSFATTSTGFQDNVNIGLINAMVLGSNQEPGFQIAGQYDWTTEQIDLFNPDQVVGSDIANAAAQAISPLPQLVTQVYMLLYNLPPTEAELSAAMAGVNWAAGSFDAAVFTQTLAQSLYASSPNAGQAGAYAATLASLQRMLNNALDLTTDDASTSAELASWALSLSSNTQSFGQVVGQMIDAIVGPNDANTGAPSTAQLANQALFNNKVNVGLTYVNQLGGTSVAEEQTLMGDSSPNAVTANDSATAMVSAIESMDASATASVTAVQEAQQETQQEAQLAQLYVLFQNRAPDVGGFTYWLDQLQGGMSLADIAQTFYLFGTQPNYALDTSTAANSGTSIFANTDVPTGTPGNPTPNPSTNTLAGYGGTLQSFANYIYTAVLGADAGQASGIDSGPAALTAALTSATGPDGIGQVLLNFLDVITTSAATGNGTPPALGTPPYYLTPGSVSLFMNKANVGLTYALGLGGTDFYTDAVDVFQTVTSTNTANAVDAAIGTVIAAPTRGMTVGTDPDAVNVLANNTSSPTAPTTATPTAYQETDRWGNVVVTTDPNSTSNLTTYRYNQDNQLIGTTEADHVQTANYYDSEGRLVATVDGNGNVNQTVYDQNGDLSAVIHADGGVTSYTYDTFGDQLSTTTSTQAGTATTTATTTNTFNQLGELIETESAAAPVYANANTTNPATDSDSQPYVKAPTTPPTATNVVEYYNYDELGRQTGDTIGTTATVAAAVDVTSTATEYSLVAMNAKAEKAYGNMASITSSTATEYDLAGNVTASIQGAGTVHTIVAESTYDAFHHVTSQSSQTTVVAENGTVVQNGITNTQTYAVNAFGQIGATVDMSGDATLNSYDDAGHLIAQEETVVNSYNLDAINAQLGKSDGTGISTAMLATLKAQQLGLQASLPKEDITYSYDGANQLMEIDDHTLNQQTYYSYDQDGNITTEQEVAPSDLGTGQAMQVVQDNHLSYDDMGRQVNVEDSRYDISYDYDANGNRIHVNTQYIADVGAIVTDLGSASGGIIDLGTDNTAGGAADEPMVIANGSQAAKTSGVYAGIELLPGVTLNIDVLNADGSTIIGYPASDGNEQAPIIGATDDGSVEIDDWNAFDAMNRETVVDGVLQDANGNDLNDQNPDTAPGAPDMPVIAAADHVGIDTEQGHKLSFDTNGNQTSDTYYGTVYNPQYTGAGPDLGYTTEYYTYDQRNQLTAITRDGIVTQNLGYDAAGHLVYSDTTNAAQTDFNLTAQDQDMIYNEAGELALETSYAVQINNTAAGPVATQTDLADVEYSYDNAGNLMWTSDYDRNPGGNIEETYYAYAATGSYKQVVEDKVALVGSNDYQGGTGTNDNFTGTNYDADGNVLNDYIGVEAYNGKQRSTGAIVKSFQAEVVNDAQGQIVNNTISGAPQIHTLIVDGQVLGSSSAAGSPDASFGNDFTSLATSIQGNGESGSVYITQTSNETFATIAQSVWGDASLWYVIADANPSLAGSATLQQGIAITLPPEPSTVHNDYQTYTPYNPTKALGAPAPTLPTPPPPPVGSGCGVAGEIVVVIIAIVAAICCQEELEPEIEGLLGAGEAANTGVAASAAIESEATVAAGAIGGAVGSLAGQVAANMLNMQSGINWGDVALGAVGGGLSAGLESPLPAVPTTTDIAEYAAQAAEANALTQGIGVLTHVQPHFEWSEVAASGIMAGVSSEVGQQISNTAFGNALGSFGVGTVAGLVGGTVAKVLTGGTESYASIGADAFGNALGGAIVGQMQQPTAAQSQEQAVVNTNNQVSGNGNGNGTTSNPYVDSNGDQIVFGAPVKSNYSDADLSQLAGTQDGGSGSSGSPTNIKVLQAQQAQASIAALADQYGGIDQIPAFELRSVINPLLPSLGNVGQLPLSTDPMQVASIGSLQGIWSETSKNVAITGGYVAGLFQGVGDTVIGLGSLALTVAQASSYLSVGGDSLGLGTPEGKQAFQNIASIGSAIGQIASNPSYYLGQSIGNTVDGVNNALNTANQSGNLGDWFLYGAAVGKVTFDIGSLVLGAAGLAEGATSVASKLGAFVDAKNAAAVVDVGATVVNQSATGIQWGQGIQAQGMPWENYLEGQLADGSRLPPNFKTFDFFDESTGEATSAKTLDTTTPAKVNDPSQVYTSLKGNIDAAANFNSYELNGTIVNSDMITARNVEVAVPAATTPTQWTQIASAMQYAANKGVNLIITVVK